MKTMPDKQETIKAIQNLDLVVAIDTMPMDIINYADVVFPECTYLERYDNINTGKFKGESEIAIRQPAIEPLWESKPSWWMTKELGSRLGLAGYFPWKDGEDYIVKRCEAGGVDFNQLKRDGVIVNKGGAPYFESGAAAEFATPSGKIELYSKQLAEKGFDPVPQYTKHTEPPTGFFRLLFGRAPLHTFSRTTNNFMLTDLQKENHLWLNAKKGRELGIKDDEYVMLVNQDGVKSGSAIKVKLTERLRDDAVYMNHGFGVHAKGAKRANSKGVADDDLISKSVIDPFMGGTSMRGNFVKIVKGGK